MFRPISVARRGTAPQLTLTWGRFLQSKPPAAGASTLLREDRVLRVMIVRNEIAATFVQGVER